MNELQSLFSFPFKIDASSNQITLMIRHSLDSSLELYKLSEKNPRALKEKIKTTDTPFYSPNICQVRGSE